MGHLCNGMLIEENVLFEILLTQVPNIV